MRFVSAFVPYSSNATAFKRELGIHFQLLKERKIERKKGTELVPDVLVANKFQCYSLTETHVDLVFCASCV